MKKGLFVICMAALFATSCTQTGKTEEDRFIEDLLSQMTLEEKIGQMNQIHFDKSLDSIKAQVRNGELGSMLNIDPKLINEIQKTAVEESRLGIPPHHRAGYCPRLQNGTAHSAGHGSLVRPATRRERHPHGRYRSPRARYYMDLRSHARHLARRPLGTYCRESGRRPLSGQ